MNAVHGTHGRHGKKTLMSPLDGLHVEASCSRASENADGFNPADSSVLHMKSSGLCFVQRRHGMKMRRSSGPTACSSEMRPSSGPKALHKPAQGKRGTSAALGIAFKKDKALKGRDNVCRPFRALFMQNDSPRALPWAGLLRAFGPEDRRPRLSRQTGFQPVRSMHGRPEARLPSQRGRLFSGARGLLPCPSVCSVDNPNMLAA